MPFRKLSDTFRQDGEGPIPPFGRSSPTGFTVTDSSFKYTVIVAWPVSTIVVFLPLLWKTHLDLHLNDADLQALSQITAALSAFMLAVPLLLKDLHHGSTFWRQFFLLATTFILATGAGVISFLLNRSEVEACGTVWLVVAIALSIQLNGLGWLTRTRFRLIMPLTFLLSLLCVVVAAVTATGDRITVLFLLLSLYGFYLTLILIAAILVQVYRNSVMPQRAGAPTTDHDALLRTAIVELANENRDHALTEDELLRRLATEKFSETPSIVSDTAVEMLVAEMDADTQPTHPLISIYKHGHSKVIPRWDAQMESLLSTQSPIGLVLTYHHYDITDDKFEALRHDTSLLAQHYENEIWKVLSRSTGFSEELLRHNIIWRDKYELVRYLRSEEDDYSSFSALLFVDRTALRISTIFPESSGGYRMTISDWFAFAERFPDQISVATRLRSFLPPWEDMEV